MRIFDIELQSKFAVSNSVSRSSAASKTLFNRRIVKGSHPPRNFCLPPPTTDAPASEKIIASQLITQVLVAAIAISAAETNNYHYIAS